MKFDIAFGLIRHLLTIVGGYYVAKDQIDQDSVNAVIGGITSLAGVAWSIHNKIPAPPAA